MSPPSATPQNYDPAMKWWIAVALSFGMISVGLGITSIDIAIPAMMSSLGTSLEKIQWVLIAFMITRTVLIPSVGWLGRRLGDRNVFIYSAAIFVAGSFLCSMAWDVNSLIFFRVIQGVGVGPLIGVAMSIMYEAFPRHERGLAMGLFMTGWSLGPFFGPLLGGYLAEHISWRTIFYLNLPTGLLSMVAAYFILPKRPSEEKPPPFDMLGFATLTGGLVALLLALTQGREEGWTSQYIMTLFATATGSLSLFVFTETRSANPYIEIRYLRNINFAVSNAIILIRVMGFRGTSFLLNLFLQKALYYTPVQTGIFLLPGAVAVGLVSPLAGTLSDRIGQRLPLILGLVILVVTLYGLSTLTIWTSVSVIFFLVILKSTGQAAMNAPLNTVALGALPEGESRMGSGILGLSRGLGEAFGIAVLSFLLEQHIFYNVDAMTPLAGARLTEDTRLNALQEIGKRLAYAGESGAGLEEKAQSLLGFSLLNEGVTKAYHELFLLIGALYAALIVLVFMLRIKQAPKPETPQQTE